MCLAKTIAFRQKKNKKKKYFSSFRYVFIQLTFTQKFLFRNVSRFRYYMIRN